MSFRLGLTGSIGVGKTVTAKFFEKHGCAVWNADEVVSRLYKQHKETINSIAKLVPEAKKEGKISKEVLRRAVFKNPHLLEDIEKIVHPLVSRDRLSFMENEKRDILVFEIPLLYETKGQNAMDAVACVNIDKNIQRERVLSRGTMGNRQFEKILSKQIPTKEKLQKADFEIVTDSFENVEQQVLKIIKHIRESLNARNST